MKDTHMRFDSPNGNPPTDPTKGIVPGKWRFEDGKFVPIEEESAAPEGPSVEISDEYAEAIGKAEKAERLEGAFEDAAKRNAWEHGQLMDALRATRTLDDFKKHLDAKFRKGHANVFSSDEGSLEERRIREAVRLNDRVQATEEKIAATDLAKEYFTYVRKGLSADGSESEAIGKTLETMEGEERELAAKAAKGAASDPERNRLKLLGEAKAVLKRLSG